MEHPERALQRPLRDPNIDKVFRKKDWLLKFSKGEGAKSCVGLTGSLLRKYP